MGVDSDELGLMDDDDDAPTVLEICPESEGRVTFWIRRASMRSVTYWVTWNRISNPTTKNDQIYAVSGLGRRKNASRNYLILPRMSVSGNKGARAINSPPKPHPMSANSTFLSLGMFG